MPQVGRAYIYVVGSGRKMLKVGIASDVKKRLRGLQTGCPLPLQLVHAIEVAEPLALPIERKIHHNLKRYRVHGEWFRVERAKAVDVAEKAANSVVRDHTLAGADEQGNIIATILCRACRHSGTAKVPASHRLKFKCSSCGSADTRWCS